ncbi:MAG: hypothetical protein HYW07_12540 [Candidatus Latescibacteria bacterium]|nr:hypothetical protein [Candidatus Latescibacterota bacterium]
MASLEARIMQLEVAVAPPAVEDLLALRRRQARALDEWAQAQANRLGITVEEFQRRQWRQHEHAQPR